MENQPKPSTENLIEHNYKKTWIAPAIELISRDKVRAEKGINAPEGAPGTSTSEIGAGNS
jgi:hypothetical protein